ncbi:TVP38/TMEM64 family protein [Geodermatophilus sp. SYSU D00815]
MEGTPERTWARLVALLVLLAVGGVAALVLDLPSLGAVRARLDDAGGTGLVVLALALGVALLAPVPRTALSVLVGAVAGFWPGLAVALGGAVLGGLGAFALGRWLGRPAATRLAGGRLARVDQLLGRRGFVSVLAARLLPVVPFTPLSYAAGLTAVRPVAYAAATVLGVVPGTVVQVGIGASAPVVTGQGTAAAVVLAVLAAVLLVGGLVRRRRRGRVAAEPGR